jgi:hypothetical protein
MVLPKNMVLIRCQVLVALAISHAQAFQLGMEGNNISEQEHQNNQNISQKPFEEALEQDRKAEEALQLQDLENLKQVQDAQLLESSSINSHFNTEDVTVFHTTDNSKSWTKAELLKPFRVTDSVHNQIELPGIAKVIIDHPIYQKMKQIRQLALVHHVYPGGLHTRFAHSVGEKEDIHILGGYMNRYCIGRIHDIVERMIR